MQLVLNPRQTVEGRPLHGPKRRKAPVTMRAFSCIFRQPEQATVRLWEGLIPTPNALPKPAAGQHLRQFLFKKFLRAAPPLLILKLWISPSWQKAVEFLPVPTAFFCLVLFLHFFSKRGGWYMQPKLAAVGTPPGNKSLVRSLLTFMLRVWIFLRCFTEKLNLCHFYHLNL